ncbi:MAG TPA: iron-containing alcohol dehydrogenase [Thermoleophilia bacterium]|nr:iron-containing alcohol dehydrogenase [Thermoleophilia bacterium]
MRFEFATATRVLFGPGTIRELPAFAASYGNRAFLVTSQIDPTNTVVDLLNSQGLDLVRELSEAGVTLTLIPFRGEPTVDAIRGASDAARAARIDMVLGFGGGSALDAAKAIACLLTNEGDPLDYLEVIGKGKPVGKPSAPCIAIPTTAGTGSEVTSNAVLASPEHRVKVSLRSSLMLPRLALVDPELTYGLPPSLTASTGMDALTQVIEPFVSVKSSPLTDALCVEGMRRGASGLPVAYREPSNEGARQDMALTSLFGGMALANAKLGAVHGFAATLGGMFDAPHGAICARLLPIVMDVNVRALQDRDPGNPTLGRYATVAQILTGDPSSSVGDGVGWLETLSRELRIPSLGTYGLKATDFANVVDKSAAASSMKGNPIRLTANELTEILERAL